MGTVVTATPGRRDAPDSRIASGRKLHAAQPSRGGAAIEVQSFRRPLAPLCPGVGDMSLIVRFVRSHSSRGHRSNQIRMVLARIFQFRPRRGLHVGPEAQHDAQLPQD